MGQSAEAGDAADRHDLPAALLQQRRQGGLDEMRDAEHVEIESGAHFSGGQLLRRRPAAAAGMEDEAVDPAMLAQDVGDASLDSFAIGYVADACLRAAAGFRDRTNKLRKLACPPRYQHDVSTMPGKALGESGANAGGRAGDKCEGPRRAGQGA
jgi:hypothetical protein